MEQTYQTLEDFYNNNKYHLDSSWSIFNSFWLNTVQYELIQAILEVMIDTSISSKQTIEINVDSTQKITVKVFCKSFVNDKLLDSVTILERIYDHKKVELRHCGLVGVNSLSYIFEIISDGRQLEFQNRKLIIDKQIHSIKKEEVRVSFRIEEYMSSFSIRKMKQMLKEYTYIYPNVEFLCNKEKIASPSGISNFVSIYNPYSFLNFKNDDLEVALTLSNDDNEHFLTIINDEITNDDNFSLESIRIGVLRAINQYFLISLSKYEIPPLVIATHIIVDAERNNFYSSRPYYRIFDGKDINEQVEIGVYQNFLPYLQNNSEFSSILKTKIEKYLEDKRNVRFYSLNDYASINVSINGEDVRLDVILNETINKDAYDIPLYKSPEDGIDIIDDVIDMFDRLINVPSRIGFDFNDIVFTIKGNKRIAAVSGISNAYNNCHLKDAIKDALDKAKQRNINVFECSNLIVNIRRFPTDIEDDAFANELNSIYDFFQKFSEQTCTKITISPKPNYYCSKTFEIDILFAGI